MNLNNHFDAALLGQLKEEAHVWFCRPDEITAPDLLANYQSMLSADERKKHQRFYSEKDRHDYLISHALVRKVLSRYRDVKPSEWKFRAGKHGKPEIVQANTDSPLLFNLTHTKGLCACAVTSGSPCGIDVEMTARNNNLQKIAERMFAAEELAAMTPLNKDASRKAFFTYWTLREAYLKAIGRGLAGSSKDVYFSVDDEIDILFKQTCSGFQDGKYWQFQLFTPTENHIAAIAINQVNRPAGSGLSVVSRTIEL